jgi:hypothetical protein
MAKSKQNPTTGLYTYGNSTVYDPAKETDLNKFNDWAENNPLSAAKYGSKGGMYNGTPITSGSGAAANNYTGAGFGNAKSPADPANVGGALTNPAASTNSFAYYGKLKDGNTGWDSDINNFAEGGVNEALGTGGSELYNYYGDGQALNLSSTIGQGETGLNSLLGSNGANSESGGMFDDWTKTGVGGSKFSNVAAGLGSLAGMYFGYKGIGAAKDALNFQKQQYADQQAQQARANKRQDDFGLALSSAMPAKRVG